MAAMDDVDELDDAELMKGLQSHVQPAAAAVKEAKGLSFICIGFPCVSSVLSSVFFWTALAHGFGGFCQCRKSLMMKNKTMMAGMAGRTGNRKVKKKNIWMKWWRRQHDSC